MNYRHHFHAGNFADLLKHAVLLDLLERATRPAAPALDLIETHAGAGVYAIEGRDVRGTREAQAGIVRLLAAHPPPPALLDRLAARVRDFNGGRLVTRYPGSPRLGVDLLRPGDRYVGCELRPDDHATLEATLRRASACAEVDVRLLCADGYAHVEALPPGRPRIVLIDPPFERGEEHLRIVRLVDRLSRASPAAVVAIWAPLKDLESLDRLRAGVEAAARAPGWIVEARLRPLRDPLAMNGCAMIVLGAAETASAALASASWIAEHLGDAGAEARLQTLDRASRNLPDDRGFASAGREGKADVRRAETAAAPKRRS